MPSRSDPTDADLDEDNTPVDVELQGMLDLIRIMAQPILEEYLSEIFENPQQIRAYELTDGLHSTREIGAMIRVDQKTVSNWWQRWESEYEIVEKAGTRGQFRKLYSLLDLMTIFGTRPK